MLSLIVAYSYSLTTSLSHPLFRIVFTISYGYSAGLMSTAAPCGTPQYKISSLSPSPPSPSPSQRWGPLTCLSNTSNSNSAGWDWDSQGISICIYFPRLPSSRASCGRLTLTFSPRFVMSCLLVLNSDRQPVTKDSATLSMSKTPRFGGRRKERKEYRRQLLELVSVVSAGPASAC